MLSEKKKEALGQEIEELLKRYEASAADFNAATSKAFANLGMARLDETDDQEVTAAADEFGFCGHHDKMPSSNNEGVSPFYPCGGPY